MVPPFASSKYRRLNGRISQKDCFIPLSKLGLLQNAFNTRTNGMAEMENFLTKKFQVQKNKIEKGEGEGEKWEIS